MLALDIEYCPDINLWCINVKSFSFQSFYEV